MLRLFFILMLLCFAALAFCQRTILVAKLGSEMDHHNKIEKYNNDPWPSQVNCPKDSIDYYFDKEQRVVYIFEVKYVKAADKCVESKSYWVRLPSGRMILISKEIWEKKTGKVVKPNNN